MTLAFPTRHSGPDDSPGFLMWQATMAWQRVLREALAPLDLTHPQFVVLACLGWIESEEGQVTQARIAQVAKLDPMMTSQIVRMLESKGWLERNDHPKDGRAFLLRPTRLGRALIRKAIPAVEAADANFFDALGRDLGRFKVSLKTLTE